MTSRIFFAHLRPLLDRIYYYIHARLYARIYARLHMYIYIYTCIYFFSIRFLFRPFANLSFLTGTRGGVRGKRRPALAGRLVRGGRDGGR